MAKVLVACEYSGRVREAFRKLGHDAYSCDLLPAEDGSPHHKQGDVIPWMYGMEWDLVIAHPPCTRLCNSGNRWRSTKKQETSEAVNFFMLFTLLPCPTVIENPIGIMSTVYRKPNQIIQPWQFGHGETKATCLWISNSLPNLIPTNVVEGREHRVHRMPPGPDRWKERSRTYQGIADAMAHQWGHLLTKGQPSNATFIRPGDQRAVA